MKITLSIKNEILILKAFKDYSNLGINEIRKKTGLYPKTFTARLKKLKKEGLVNYSSQQGKKTEDAKITEKGLAFLNETSSQIVNPAICKDSLNDRGVPRRQIKQAIRLYNADLVSGGKIGKWKCSKHGKKNLTYQFGKDGAHVYCEEPDCNENKHFLLDYLNFEKK